MAVLTISDAIAHKMNVLTANTLSASDTVTLNPGDLLIFHNTTGGSLTATLTGEANVLSPDGAGQISASGGAPTTAVAAGAGLLLWADTRIEFLRGITTVTGASGMTLIIIRR